MSIGAMTREEINDYREVVRDGVFAGIVSNNDEDIEGMPVAPALLEVEVNDYAPVGGEEWDVEAWEARQGLIYALPGRAGWKLAYRIARVLARGVPVRIQETGLIIELPSVVTITEGCDCPEDVKADEK